MIQCLNVLDWRTHALGFWFYAKFRNAFLFLSRYAEAQ